MKLQPKDIGLKSSSFGLGVPDVPHRIIANVEAREKERKTTFSLTAPDPIIAMNLDPGMQGIIQQAIKKGKKIIVAGMDQGPNKLRSYTFIKPKPAPGQDPYDRAIVQETANRARVVWRQWKVDYIEALQSKARTIVVDTGGAAFQLSKYARFGRFKRVLPRDHDELYQEFQGIMQDAQNYDKNVLWIHRLGEEWADHINQKGEKESIKTGRWVRKSAYRDVGFEVQMNIRLEKYLDKKKKTHCKLTILDCQIQEGLEGTELEDELCTFPYLAATVFGTDTEEWE